MQLSSFWWIPTELSFISVYPCSTSLCTSIILPLFLRSPLKTLFVFSSTYCISLLKANFSHAYKTLRGTYFWFLTRSFHRVPITIVLMFSSIRSHLCFTQIVSICKRYLGFLVGTPSPSGQSHHHWLSLILPYLSEDN